MATMTYKPNASELVTLLTTLDGEKDRLAKLIARNEDAGLYSAADYFKVMLGDINALYNMFSGAATIEIVKHTW